MISGGYAGGFTWITVLTVLILWSCVFIFLGAVALLILVVLVLIFEVFPYFAALSSLGLIKPLIAALFTLFFVVVMSGYLEVVKWMTERMKAADGRTHCRA